MTTAMSFEIRDGAWATDLQNALEEYMETLYNSVDAEEGSPEEAAGLETESGIPFCGCNTCEGREILSFLSPRIIKGYLDKKIGFVEAFGAVSDDEVIDAEVVEEDG